MLCLLSSFDFVVLVIAELTTVDSVKYCITCAVRFNTVSILSISFIPFHGNFEVSQLPSLVDVKLINLK